MHPYMGLEGVLFFVIRIYPQDFYPFSIVEVALPVGKRPLEELIDLANETLAHRKQHRTRTSTSHWSIRSPDSLNHFLISSTFTSPVSFSSKHSNAPRSSCSESKSYKCSPIIVKNMGNVIPLSPDESKSAEGFLLCVPGRSLRRSSIRCLEALIPTRTERLSVGTEGYPAMEQRTSYRDWRRCALDLAP